MGSTNTIFFPGLNGLRAIAALAVVWSHTTVALHTFGLNQYLLGTLPNGNPKGIDLSDFAVSIFFALSGFLITYLLMAEQTRCGINIRNFYIRRILRIWPLYYAYFLVALAVIHWWSSPHDNSYNLFYIFFMANVPKVFQSQSDLLGHYWSLGVEEQFYLLWPVFVWKFAKRILPATLWLTIALLGLKFIAHYGYPGSLFETTLYINRFDCMLIGALGGILYFQSHSAVLSIAQHPLAQALGWLVVVLAATNRFHIANILDHEIMSTATVILILGQISGKGLLNLNLSGFDYLGKLSYGIYIIHPLLIFALPAVLSPLTASAGWAAYVAVYLSVTGCTILVAHVSYAWLEKPFLQIKQRFTVVKSAAAKTEVV